MELKLKRKRPSKKCTSLRSDEVDSYAKNGRPVSLRIGGQLNQNTHF